MKIAYIAAGAAGSYCGNCLRDHAMAVAMRRLGTDITLVPTYTPLLTDLPHDESGVETGRRGRLFFNGVRVYLEQKLAYLRRPRPVLDRLLGSRWIVGLLSRMQMSTDPAKLGDLTESMLQGEKGHQARELEELVQWLARDVRPDLVHLSNALLLGMARRVKEVLTVPVFSTLQSEDIFLDGLVEPYRRRCLELIRERGEEVDGLIAVSAYYADYAVSQLGLPREKISVVFSGIPLEGHEPAPSRDDGGLTIGYLARIAPEKGLHLLVDVFCRAARDRSLPPLRLKVAGYLPPSSVRYAASLRRRLSASGLRDRADFLGTVTRDEKLRFLREIDVLAVPTIYREPKGLFALEAMASGVPVVVPRHGAFPELLEHTGGGRMHEPESADDLERVLRGLLADPTEMQALGRRGREAVLDRFSAERMARETLDIYDQVLSGSGRGTSSS